MSKPIEPEHVMLEFYTTCSFHPDDEPATAPVPLFVLGYREGGEPVFVWLVDKHHFDGSRLTKGHVLASCAQQSRRILPQEARQVRRRGGLRPRRTRAPRADRTSANCDSHRSCP